MLEQVRLDPGPSPGGPTLHGQAKLQEAEDLHPERPQVQQGAVTLDDPHAFQLEPDLPGRRRTDTEARGHVGVAQHPVFQEREEELPFVGTELHHFFTSVRPGQGS